MTAKLFDDSVYFRLSFGADGRLTKAAAKELKANGKAYCSQCTQVKPLEDFPLSKGTRYHYCRVCTRGIHRKASRGRARGVKMKREETKQQYVDLLGGKCCRCGYDIHLSALDFHHVAPQSKRFNLSAVLSRTTPKTIPHDEMLAEVNRCALLCANCHRAYEAGDWQGQWVKRDSMGWELAPVNVDLPSFDD